MIQRDNSSKGIQILVTIFLKCSTSLSSGQISSLEMLAHPNQDDYHQEMWQQMLRRMKKKEETYSLMLGLKINRAIMEIS